MAQTVQIDLAIKVTRTAALDGGPLRETQVVNYNKTFTDGSGTDQADLAWVDSRTLNTGTETHDLTSVSQLTSGDAAPSGWSGAGRSFDNVKVLYFENTGSAGGSGYSRIGAAGANPFDGAGTPFQVAGGKIDVPPGGILLWVSPVGGTSTSGAENLLVESVTANQTYKTLVVGDD